MNINQNQEQRLKQVQVEVGVIREATYDYTGFRHLYEAIRDQIPTGTDAKDIRIKVELIKKSYDWEPEADVRAQLTFSYLRPETEEEMKKRKDTEEILRLSQEETERKQLAELKAKYE